MRSTMQDVPLTLTGLLRVGATTSPDTRLHTATGTDGRTRSESFADAVERAARLASGLRGLGVRGDERVATFLWNNAEHLECYLAVPCMGAVLHTLNIRLVPAQLGFIATHAEDRVVVVDASLAEALAPAIEHMPTVRTVLVCGAAGDTAAALAAPGRQVLAYDDLLAASSPVFAWPDLDEHSAAAMCYTSGTTGDPKGVVYSHRSSWLHAMAVCTGNAAAITCRDRVLPVVPMFHANAWGLPYAALMAGADLLLPDRFTGAAALVGLIERERATIAGAVPTVWTDVLEWLRTNPGHELSSLDRLLCGGAAAPRALIAAYDRELGIPIRHAWGMTETSPVATSGLPPRDTAGDAALDLRAAQGRLLFGVEARLVDDGGGELPRDGKAVGEVEVRGPWVTGSYHRGVDPDRFHDGWLRTGDVGTIDPRGYLTLTDRAKDVIKSGGEWISSVALETTLMGHPEVVEACVVGVADERWQERPLALVVRRPGSDVRAAELRDWLTGKVAAFWVPDNWAFVETVPRTGVGKFDKKAVRRSHSQGQVAVERT